MQMKQYTYPLCVLSLLAITSATALSASRTVGPEPGLGFAAPPSGISICSYGDYIRSPLSAFGGNCSKLLKAVDTELNQGTSATESYFLLPFSIVSQYNVKVNYSGMSGLPGMTPLKQNAVNLADPLYQQYVLGPFMNDMLAKYGPNHVSGVPVDSAHPTYISLDGWSSNYSYIGAVVNGIWKGNVIWQAGYPSSRSEWYTGVQAFVNYAKNYATQIRLSPHTGSMEDWSVFKTVYANCPAMLREWFPISKVPSYGAYQRSQFYNQLINLYWFANVPPPVFSNDPPTRIVQWGTLLDNGDMQTALAIYMLMRGANTFFDVQTGSYGAVPSTWLPITTKVGNASGSGSIEVLRTASGQSVSSGYNLLKRTYSNGAAYFNLTGTTQTISLPAGSKNWSGGSISSIALADGKGYVVIGL
jgi:hypothetical protein